ncbi:CBL-interacting serine/threonine-protein kinase 17 [Termitomyces sp. T112]|nr:CBL-interacting serine/threonine-protein kinase 17 [Termitomyces sp. T112]
MNSVEIGRPAFNRAFTNAVATPTEPLTPTIAAPVPRSKTTTMHVKRVTLTSKKNWWMVEMDEEEEKNAMLVNEETGSVDRKMHYMHGADEQRIETKRAESPPPSPIYNPPRHPTSIFSFPTPTAYSAPPNPTASITPCARGSASELFKCVVKKPDVIQLEINGEMHSNASDVTVQFLAELRVYTTLSHHRNICAFLGSLENVGMVLEYLDGRTLYDVIIARPPLTELQKIDYHNQLLDGLTHLHSYGLSHGDLSLLNVQVVSPGDTIKLLDFGRSVSADSVYRAPDDEPVDPFDELHRRASASAAPIKVPEPKVEQIHPGTRPFSAPEILRGECQDARLADAYSFGMILVCLDRCESVDVKPWEQRADQLPLGFFRGPTLGESHLNTMSGTHDILAAERAAAAANKQSNQGIWQGQAEGQLHQATTTADVIDKDASSSRVTGRKTAQDTVLSGATSSDVHGGIGHPGSGQTSQELH